VSEQPTKEEQVLKDLLKAVQAYQSRTNEPATELSDDFRKGARAMFDSLLCRAANNYHGNPSVDAACTEENKIVTAWAADALAEVSVDDWNEWVSITDLRRENDELKAQVRAAPPPPVEHLRDALVHAVSVIQTWHNMSIPKAQRSELWDTYWKSAPEMVAIRNALTKGDAP
jgi:hypothetical protein